jgi:hypothetical protein
MQTLIHKSSVVAYNQGAKDEQERIIRLLEKESQGDYKQVMLTPQLIELIKGEQK